MSSTPKKLKNILGLYNKLINELQEFIEFVRTENQKTELNLEFDNELQSKLVHIHDANQLLTNLYNETNYIINVKTIFVKDMQVEYYDDDDDKTIIASFVKYSDDYLYCVIAWEVNNKARNAYVSVNKIKQFIEEEIKHV